MLTETIVEDILCGLHDDVLERISSALKQRYNIRSAIDTNKKLSEISIGDRVKFNSHASPKYLQGCGAEVVGVSGDKFIIHVDQNFRAKRFSGSRNVKCPANILDKE